MRNIKSYGFPYYGSKNTICEEIINFLPKGKRLVDLFGGGFAISHCALTFGKDKYDSVMYNDVNPLVVRLLNDILNGRFNEDTFKPQWVSKDDFDKLKETDGYIKYIWSFGNKGTYYVFGKHRVENVKLSFDTEIKNETFWQSNHKIALYLKRMNRIKLKSINNLEICNIDYKDYKYKNGDVVYCNIPYPVKVIQKGTYNYNFDFNGFYNWASSKDYPVFFSSFDDLKDDRFKILWSMYKPNRLTTVKRGRCDIECIYGNKVASNIYSDVLLF